MLKLTEIVTTKLVGNVDDVLTLAFESRQKSRLSAKTDSGKDVAIFLSRGQILRSGTILTGPDEFNVLIKAAPESVSVLGCNDLQQFARACYHLGNRHVPLQILEGELCYLTDHVLDEMLAGLKLKVSHEMLPFEPEAGAYHSHAN